MTLRTIALFCLCVLLAGAAASTVAGTWKVSAKGSDGSEHRLDLQIKDDAGKLSAAMITEDGNSIPIQEIKLDTSELSFKVEVEGDVYAVKLTVSGDSMKGKYTSGSGETGTLEATR